MAKQALGAYEQGGQVNGQNPIVEIDRQSNKIIDEALGNLSTRFQKAMQNQEALKSQELINNRKNELADQEYVNANYERFVTSVSKSGTRSDSFYNLGYQLINKKFDANRAFANAVTDEEKNKARNELAVYTKDLVLLSKGGGGIDEMNKESLAVINAVNNNQPGGFNTGSYDPKELNDVAWEDLTINQQIGRNMYQRRQLATDGTTYEMKGSQLYALDNNGGASYSVEELDSMEQPQIENYGLTMKKLFNETGIMKNGKFTEAYLNRKGSKEFTEGNIQGTVIPSNMPAAIDTWSEVLKKKAAGIVNSGQGWDDFATNNSTYLAYAGENAKDLTYSGNYVLDPESKERYTQSLIKFGLKKFLKQYEIENVSETDETQYEAIPGSEDFGVTRLGQKEKKPKTTKNTGGDKGVKYTPKQLEAIKISANVATAGNVFNIPVNKAGDKMNPDAEINIPATDSDDYKPFKNNLKVLGFKIIPMTNGKEGKFKKQIGYFIGNNREAKSKQFQVFFDDKTTGRDFYRDLFVNLNVPQSEMERRLDSVFSNLEKTNAEATYKRRAEEDQKSLDNSAKSNLPGG